MKTILIVDDDPDILEVLKFRLKKTNFKVLTASTGEEALAMLQKVIPDVILLDLLLPGIQGEDVCKRIKKNARLKQIPVIVFTAYTDRISELTTEIGASDFILKPFDPEDLLAKLKKYAGYC